MPLGLGRVVFGKTQTAVAGSFQSFVEKAFLAESDTNITINADVKYDDTKFNQDSFITVSGTGDSFTITEAGRYYINSSIKIANSAGSRQDNHTLLLLKNNGTTIAKGVGQQFTISSDIFAYPMAQGYFDLAANDVITIDTENVGGSSKIQSTDTLFANLFILKITDNDQIHLSRSSAQTLDYGGTFTGGTSDSRYFTTKDIEFNQSVDKETGFTHSTSTNSNVITIDDSGNYFLSANLDITATGISGYTNASSVVRVLCEDTNYGGGGAGSGTYGDTGITSGMTCYADGNPAGKVYHNLFGVLNTSESNVDVKLVIDSESIADSNRVMDYSVNTDSFLKICKMGTGDNLFIGLNDIYMNSELKMTDTEIPCNNVVKKDSSYTHSTASNPGQITCESGSRYLIMGSAYHRTGCETAGGINGQSFTQFQRIQHRIKDITNSVDVKTNQSLPSTRYTILVAGGFNYQDDDLGNEDGVEGGAANRGQDGMDMTAVSFMGMTDQLAADTTLAVAFNMVPENGATNGGRNDPTDDSNYCVKNTTGSTVNGVANNDYGFGIKENQAGVFIIKL